MWGEGYAMGGAGARKTWRGWMVNCEQLRQRLVERKQARNNAMVANATSEDAGEDPPYSEEDLMELRAAVHMAALEAREAGCDVSDLVGWNVGDPDAPF